MQCRRYFRGHWHPAARQRQNNHFMTPEVPQSESEFASSIDTIPERHDSTFIVAECASPAELPVVPLRLIGHDSGWPARRAGGVPAASGEA